MRERGWTHWHHLFNSRQLLTYGLLLQNAASAAGHILAGLLLGLGRCLDYNGKLCTWAPQIGYELSTHVFANQALNTNFNYTTRGLIQIKDTFFLRIPRAPVYGHSTVVSLDARSIKETCDFWITDPPYADAVNYHELSEYFLAWYGDNLKKLMPGIQVDSKRALAVQGADQRFRRSMVDCYTGLVSNMPDKGYQVVMFTHQDATVWADLTLILWSAGLQVASAWCIGTETDTALKEGNYVQGTVFLVLKKQMSDVTAFLDEVFPQVELEVENQLKMMLTLDDRNEPNFGDADYQLAAYAAALKVLTRYKSIEDVDVKTELSRARARGETSPVEQVITNAVKVACEFLVPNGFDGNTWKTVSSEERFYLKGLEVESRQEFRSGVYQELARGFGVRDYQFMLSSKRANQTRLKNATEFASRSLDDTGFGASPTRQVLFAIREIVRNEDDVQFGKNWLKNEVRDYWGLRKHLINISRYLAQVGQFLEGWEKDANAARLLAGALENDHA
jgi:hypothetical protein